MFNTSSLNLCVQNYESGNITGVCIEVLGGLLQINWTYIHITAIVHSIICVHIIYIITSRICGRGNVFIVYVHVCVCVCVCLFVRAITFEPVNIETSFLVWWYILTISRSSLSEYQGHWFKVKVISWKMLIWLPGHQFNSVWLIWGEGHKWGQGHTKVIGSRSRSFHGKC